MKKFTNTAKPISTEQKYHRNPYGFDKVPILLFEWSRLFQRIISQAGTYLFTKKFHTRECGIYKCEGGCVIDGVGDLVLGTYGCYFDYGVGKRMEAKAQKLADLITKIVLEWDPENPIDTMLQSAADVIKMPVADFKAAIEKQGTCGGVFGSNALSDFFDWNPFSEAPINREYDRFCKLKFDNKTNAEIDQEYADQDLGKKLLQEINKKIKTIPSQQYNSALCCSPKRFVDNNKLHFWINTGRSTVIDGWKTEEDIQKFLEGTGLLKDTAKY